MKRPRIIPVLGISGSSAVKTVKFRKPKYIGDPLNALRIFNEKEVDEIIITDITASIEKRGPNIPSIADLASECFMPVSYGGGIRSLSDVENLLAVGIEKIIINSLFVTNPKEVSEIVKRIGSQSVAASIDVKRNCFKRLRAWTHSGSRNTGLSVQELVKRAEDLGCGEIVITSIERDGTREGYDLDLIQAAAAVVRIPVVAYGGAASLQDCASAIKAGAAGAAAGSLFTLRGPHDAVLISYPSEKEIQTLLD
jgi:cyclase